MSIGAELGQYILQTQFKKILNIQCVTSWLFRCRVSVRVMAKIWLYYEFQSKTDWSWQL